VQDSRAEQENWHSLFRLLNIVAKDENDGAMTLDVLVNDNSDEYQKLTNFWQKRLQEQLSVNTQANIKEREVKTLEIEILAQVESPAEYADQRMAVQVSLMQEQMLSGAGIDLSQSLVNWLRLGKLSHLDLALLDRLNKVYK